MNESDMNGAQSLVRTLLGAGVDTCFANPGTSEMHFVAALDEVAGMRCVLGLFEGVVTGAADGYGRMAGKPAATLLHCGPGLANGLANLHNARRARTPILNIVGDQATYHRPLDPPLTAATEGWAGPVSVWTRTVAESGSVGADAAEAIRAARTAPGGIATLILPSDVCWNPGGVVAEALAVPPAPRVDEAAITHALGLLRSGEPCAVLLGEGVLRADELDLAARIGAATGAKVLAPYAAGRMEHGRGRAAIARLPYLVPLAVALFKGIKHVILVGRTRPVAFFAYPGQPQTPEPADAQIHVLARPEHDQKDCLERLVERLEAPALAPAEPAAAPLPARGPVTAEALAQTLCALLPDAAVVVDESISFGRPFFSATHRAAPHDWLALTGGAIGDGLPMATGAALAVPGRRVVTLQADGSAMYTVQALWTQARQGLDVTTVILSNRRYAILLHELANVGAHPGRTALDMLNLGNPDLDWVKIANGFGVEAARADTMERFADLFSSANRRRGPFLIELAIP
ncbi:MAG: acetolactate synthase large subunit [Holophaga sp.]|nr:acetolactate synthase large subunit [Holophaga sp.]